MKKTWFVIILFILLALADILFKSFFSDDQQTVDDAEPDINVSSPESKSDKKQDLVDAEKQPAGIIEKKEEDLPVEKPNTARISKSVNFEKSACENFTASVLSAKGLNIPDVNIDFVSEMDESRIKSNIVVTFAKYQICKAFETKDMGICKNLGRFFELKHSVEECNLLYRLFIPIQAHYVMQMSSEQFRDLYEDEPKELRDWMYEFYDILSKGDHESCKRIADNEDMLDICRYATGAVKTPPEDENWKEFYYTLLAIKTGQLSYLVQLKDSSFLDALVKTVLGRKKSCSYYFEKRMQSFCVINDKKD